MKKNLTDIFFMKEVIKLAKKGAKRGDGGPFGAVVVKDNRIIGKGWNKVIALNDPTAHAEIIAIRDACANIKSFQLKDCVIYSSCEPCPMCLGAIYWARPQKLVYGCTRNDAAKIGFDDEFIYKEITKPLSRRKIRTMQMMRKEGCDVLREWYNNNDRVRY